MTTHCRLALSTSYGYVRGTSATSATTGKLLGGYRPNPSSNIVTGVGGP